MEKIQEALRTMAAVLDLCCEGGLQQGPEIAQQYGIPFSAFQLAFEKEYAVPLKQYCQKAYLNKALDLLQQGRSINAIYASFGWEVQSGKLNYLFRKLNGSSRIPAPKKQRASKITWTVEQREEILLRIALELDQCRPMVVEDWVKETRQFGITYPLLNRHFKEQYGLTMSGYLAEARIKKAVAMLEAGQSVTAVNRAFGLVDDGPYLNQLLRTKYGPGVTAKTFIKRDKPALPNPQKKPEKSRWTSEERENSLSQIAAQLEAHPYVQKEQWVKQVEPFGVTYNGLSLQFKEKYGCCMRDYARSIQLKKAAELKGKKTIQEINVVLGLSEKSKYLYPFYKKRDDQGLVPVKKVPPKKKDKRGRKCKEGLSAEQRDMALQRVAEKLEGWESKLLPDGPTLAAECGVSPTMVYKDFSKKFGISMYDFYANIRVKKAKELLNKGADPALVKQRFGYSQGNSIAKLFSWRKKEEKRKIDLPVAIAFRQDGETFKRIFDKYYRDVCAFAAYLLRNSFAPLETAEDLVQELFVRLWEKWKDFFTETEVKAFLMISARNAAINHLRNNVVRKKATAEQLYRLSDGESDHGHRMENKELTDFVWKKVDQLPPKRRKVFLLRFYQGFSNAQIMEEMCISKPTVKEQLQIARTELRKLLGIEN